MIQQKTFPFFRSLVVSMVVVGLSSIAILHAQDKESVDKGSIVVPVTNLQNLGKGQLLGFLYKKVNRVEVNGVRYFRRVSLPVTASKMDVTFKDIPYGEYAIAIMHDMDKDFKMDTNFIGIPNEDLGVSNNVKGGPLGGPKWKVAKFKHQKSDNRITSIKMWQCYD